jgi:hypothetical protein
VKKNVTDSLHNYHQGGVGDHHLMVHMRGGGWGEVTPSGGVIPAIEHLQRPAVSQPVCLAVIIAPLGSE